MLAQAHSLEKLHYLGALVLPHETIIDVEEVKPIGPQSLSDDDGGYSGVYSPGNQEEDRLSSDLLPDLRHLLIHVLIHAPGPATPADLEHEVRDHLGSVDGVVDFRVELKPVALEGVRADGRVSMLPAPSDREPQLLEPRADGCHRVVMAHPDSLRRLQSSEEGVLPLDLQIRPTPFATTVDDLPPVVLGDLLVAEAKTQDGDVQVVNGFGVVLLLTVRREGRAARDDDAPISLEG